MRVLACLSAGSLALLASEKDHTTQAQPPTHPLTHTHSTRGHANTSLFSFVLPRSSPFSTPTPHLVAQCHTVNHTPYRSEDM